jgi:hypothetical protein
VKLNFVKRKLDQTRNSVRMIVVVIVPIAISVPPVIVFTPPAVAVFPAPLAGDFEFRTLRFGLRTIPAVLFSGAMQLVIDTNDSPLAVFLIGTRILRAEQQERPDQGSSQKDSPLDERKFQSKSH